MRKEYGIGGGSHAGGFEGYNYTCNGKGILIRKGYDDNVPKVQMNWNTVAKEINLLIRNDRYLNEKEKAHYPEWLAEQQIKRAEIALMYQNRDILSTAPTEKEAPDDDIIGKEVTIDDHIFVIESVGKISGDVSMRDVTFQNATGVPINRVEKIGYVFRLLEQQNIDPNAKLVTETEAVYPAEQNGLPYDIVIEKLRIEEPEQSVNTSTILATRCISVLLNTRYSLMMTTV